MRLYSEALWGRPSEEGLSRQETYKLAMSKDEQSSFFAVIMIRKSFSALPALLSSAFESDWLQSDEESLPSVENQKRVGVKGGAQLKCLRQRGFTASLSAIEYERVVIVSRFTMLRSMILTCMSMRFWLPLQSWIESVGSHSNAAYQQQHTGRIARLQTSNNHEGETRRNLAACRCYGLECCTMFRTCESHASCHDHQPRRA
jgi:hypothetical protein